MKDILLYSVHPGDTLLFALAKLNKSSAQILLVLDIDGTLLGVVTDGDIRRYILRKQDLETPVESVMNRDFTAVQPHEAHKALDIMREKSIQQMPVVDGAGRVMDLILLSDLLGKRVNARENPVVIMAGGKGTRLSPLTKIIPKPLVPVGDKTMIELIMNQFAEQGYGDFHIVVNYKKELIKSYFFENDLHHNVTFAEETEFLGTAGGLTLLRDKLDTTFILTNCDIITSVDMDAVINYHRQKKALLTILGVERKLDIPYGVIKTEQGYVYEIEEKPSLNYQIVSGIYVLEPEVLDRIPEGQVYGMDQLISSLLGQENAVACYSIGEEWFDVGQFEEYKVLLNHFK